MAGMNNEIFDNLSNEEKLAYVKEMLSKTFGREQVERCVAAVTPLVLNMCGHGEPLPPGDASDPKSNYWKGVWQVYEAE